MKTLFYVPRFRAHTIIHPLRAKYGRVLLYAYPKSSHGGIKANNLMTSICKLAGISNIGIKVRAFIIIILLDLCCCSASDEALENGLTCGKEDYDVPAQPPCMRHEARC